MSEAILLVLTFTVVVMALFRPWVGIMAYYLLATLSPPSIWPWVFDDYRISYYIAIATIIGVVFHVIMGKVNFDNIKNKQSLFILVYWGLIRLSDFLTPYAHIPIPLNMYPPEFVLGILDKQIIFYFILVLLIDSKEKIKYLSFMLIATCAYYTYWANDQYLSGELWRYTVNGRLKGPVIYKDENAFAVMFITTIPFVFSYGNHILNKVQKLAFWSWIPLSWHAIFLIGSRGAFLALAVTTFIMARQTKSKFIFLVLVVGLTGAVITQGGTMFSRTSDTIQTAQTNEGEAPINPRIITWTAGFKAMLDHPILGVGAERFQLIGGRYMEPGHKVQVIHNTFLQVAAQSGLFAGLIYLWFFYRVYRPINKLTSSNAIIYNTENAIKIALLGFFITAIFLNLLINEFLYLLLGMAQIIRNLKQEEDEIKTLNKESELVQ